MSVSLEAMRFDEGVAWVELGDGRTMVVPLAWFPHLLHASPVERESPTLSRAARTGKRSTRTFQLPADRRGRGTGRGRAQRQQSRPNASRIHALLLR